MPFVANCSLLFTEFPLLERPAAARAAGFEEIEFWWPFPSPVPDSTDVDAFVASVKAAGVTLTGLNFYAGDLTGPDCGVLSVPGRAAQFRRNVPVAVRIGERLGVRNFNALYGNRVAGVPGSVQDDMALDSLGYAAQQAAAIGAGILIEPVSGPKPYPLRSAADVSAVLARLRAAGTGSAGMLFDLYHLASNGEDIDAAITAHAAEIRHVQVADAPGRGEPGSGSLDIARYLRALRDAGYDGLTALEYVPTTAATTVSLGWLEALR
jgi:hydroxypyruvate isomerase